MAMAMLIGGSEERPMARRVSLRISIVVSLVAVLSILGAGIASAAAPNPPNCMGKDMGLWAREGSSIADGTGYADFTSGSGWGRFVAQSAQTEAWGPSMVAHLAGVYGVGSGMTCQPPA